MGCIRIVENISYDHYILLIKGLYENSTWQLKHGNSSQYHLKKEHLNDPLLTRNFPGNTLIKPLHTH